MVSVKSHLDVPLNHIISRCRNWIFWKTIFISSLVFGIVAGSSPECVAQNPTPEFSTPRSIKVLNDSSGDFLLVASANKVSCLNPNIGATVSWENHLETSVAGLAFVNSPNGRVAVATDVKGGVYAWNSSGKLLDGWPRQLSATVTAAPTWINWGGGVVAIPDHGGLVHVLKLDGENLPGWPIQTDARVLSAVGVAIMGDEPIVVVTTEGGVLWAFRDSGKSVDGFPIKFDAEFIATPAVGDLTGDGNQEICIGSLDGTVRLLELSGRVLPGWPVQVKSAVGTTPSFGDINGNGRDEIVVVTREGEVSPFDIEGTVLPGWPQTTPGLVLSSPTLVDLDGFSGKEVLVTSKSGWAYCWSGKGEVPQYWPRKINVASRISPVIQKQADTGIDRIVLPATNGVQFVSVASFHPQANIVSMEKASESEETKPSVFSLRMNSNPLIVSQGGHAVHLSIPNNLGSTGVSTTVEVFDISGRRISEIFSGELEPGEHVLPWVWNRPIPSGVYFVRAVTGKNSIASKILILQ